MTSHPELSELVHRRGDPDIQAHLASCARCRVALRLYRADPLAEEAPEPEPAPPADPAADPTTEETAARYTDLGLLSRGGMGEVRRVHDHRLERQVVMKVGRPAVVATASGSRRFLLEARANARLQHPGIVPVYDLGRLPDGRHYYTMEEVVGQTFSELVHRVHAAVVDGEWRTTESGWSLRRLVDGVRQAAAAISHAHGRGVLHRDIKPANILVGRFGEVRVVDWGLARIRDRRDALPKAATSPDARHTQLGVVAGTPAYMAPEQATQGLAAAEEGSDVYSLGAVLYMALDGQHPYPPSPSAEVLAAVRAGPPRSPQPPAPVHPDLLEICARAMARQPDHRHPDAGTLARELGAWLDGARDRDRALATLAEARALAETVAQSQEQAEARLAEATAALSALPPSAEVEARAALWETQDAAMSQLVDAEAADAGVGQLLRQAVADAPGLSEARAALGRWYRDHRTRARQRGQPRQLARWERLLRALDPVQAAAWLDAPGTVHLQTEPPGAQVVLQSWVEQGRRLQLSPEVPLGRTPLEGVCLPPGSHLLTLRAPGHAPVRYPVFLEAGDSWRGQRPGDSAPTSIRLPADGELGEDDLFVPPGWFLAGEAGKEDGRRLQRVWVDGFVIRRFPVTNREWLDWLNQLVREGRADEAERSQPRERGSEPGLDGPPLLARTPEGGFALAADGDGHMWKEDVPMVMVKVAEAERFAADLAARTGLPWRLPYELEWQKAARGVDGRRFPWGAHSDRSWSHSLHTRPDRKLPDSITACPIDESPYGVRGLGGNVADWCADTFTDDPPPVDAHGRAILQPAPPGVYRATKGGCWIWHHRYGRTDLRNGHAHDGRTAEIGVRLVRPWPG